MKMNFRIALVTLLWVLLAGGTIARAQVLASIQGKCKDQQGQPIAGATIEMQNMGTGQKHTLKTDRNGSYFSVGIETGSYKVSLIQDGKVLFFFNKVPLHLNPDNSPTVVDFDLAKEYAGGGASHRAGSGRAMARCVLVGRRPGTVPGRFGSAPRLLGARRVARFGRTGGRRRDRPVAARRRSR